MLVTYLRLFLVIQFNPGVVPLGPLAVEQRQRHKKELKEKRRQSGPCGRLRGDDLEANRYEGYWPDPNVDSPGLERFYSKDVFICHTDGRPRWCSSCCNWKQDRASHCSEIGRCVKKMDHYCPWVGGIVGETCRFNLFCQWTGLTLSAAYKFFVQFTFYTAIYCAIIIVAAAICLSALIQDGLTTDGFVIAAIALGGFFGVFTFTMTGTAVRYICVNLTNVDYLKAKTLVHQLAIRVPRGTPPGADYGVITYPLPRDGAAAAAAGTPLLDRTAAAEPVSPRDHLASRTFAIVRTEKGENPWDLGLSRNWKSVMGSNIADWLLPFNPSPCESFENNESFYEMGPLIQELRRRFNLPEVPPSERNGVDSSNDKRREKHG